MPLRFTTSLYSLASSAWVRFSPAEIDRHIVRIGAQYGLDKSGCLNWKERVLRDVAKTDRATRIGLPLDSPWLEWRADDGGMSCSGLAQLGRYVDQKTGAVDLTWWPARWVRAGDSEIYDLALHFGLRLRDMGEFRYPPEKAWLEVRISAIEEAFQLRMAAQERSRAARAPLEVDAGGRVCAEDKKPDGSSSSAPGLESRYPAAPFEAVPD